MIDTDTYIAVVLPGRPVYWLPRDSAKFRAAVKSLVRNHERIRRTPVLSAKEKPV